MNKHSGSDLMGITGKVTLVLESLDGKIKKIIKASNIITDAGDAFYAQRAGGQTPTNAFHLGKLLLGTAGNAPSKTSIYSDITSIVSGSLKSLDATYPKTQDPDTDNTGAGVDILSYRTSYTSGEANANNIDRIAITIDTPLAGSPLLMYAVVTAFNKTSNEVLKVFVNHTFNGL